MHTKKVRTSHTEWAPQIEIWNSNVLAIFVCVSTHLTVKKRCICDENIQREKTQMHERKKEKIKTLLDIFRM